MTHLPKAKRPLTNHTGTKLTATQSVILTAGAQRVGKLAMPLPKGLAGAAAKMAVTRMIDLGWLKEVDTSHRPGGPLWRETGDGHGTTLVVTDAGLLAIGIEPMAMQTMVAIREPSLAAPAPNQLMPRARTKQALLIVLLQAPEGATMEAIIAATGWKAHSVPGFMTGTLGKNFGLPVTSVKEDGRARVYRISRKPT